MKRKLETVLIRLEDHFRINNYSALGALPNALLAFAAPTRRSRISASISVALYHARRSFGPFFVSRARKAAAKAGNEIPIRNEVSISRSAIVKPFVSNTEPGLMVVSFEHELSKLVTLAQFSALESEYRIIFLPTWQPFYSEAMCLLDARARQPYFLMPSAFTEQPLCEQFSPKCHFLPFHAASWVRHSAYERPHSVKDVDILMIANFSRYKRHWKLFEALQSMPAGLRTVIAGVPLGKRTKESLLDDARLFGVEKRVEIVERATDDELRDLLRRSRIFCATTHKEGSYIAVAEALMAGVPVAMFENAIVGTKVYVTAETGVLLSPTVPLAEQLVRALAVTRDMDPRSWARKNISAEANSLKLNGLMKQWSMEHQLAWTQDVEPFYCEHFIFRYLNEATETTMTGEYERVRRQFGLAIERS